MIQSLLLYSLATLAQADEDRAWNASYVVRFGPTDTDRHEARVEATLRWNRRRGSRPESVDLWMAEGLPDGYGTFVRDLEPITPDGSADDRRSRRIEVEDRAAGHYVATVGRDGQVRFRYNVVLEHDPGPGKGIGWDETPHRFMDGVLWTGRALFVTPDDAAFELRFEAAEGERVSTSLTPAGDDSNTGRAARTADLRETYLGVGRHAVREFEISGADVTLAVDGAAAESIDFIEETVTRFMTAASELVDGSPPARCQVIITATSEEGGGSTYHRDAHYLVKGPPQRGGDPSWQRVLCHEMFHLWVPGLIGFDSREMWYSEGFTDYFAHRLMVDSGLLEPDHFQRLVEGWIGAYLGQVGPIGLRKAGELGAKNNNLIYQGGALAALCLDIALRKASRNKRSLGNVMAELYRRCGSGAGNKIPITEMEQLLGKHGGRSLGKFLDRHVAGNDPLPLKEALADAGLLFRQETVQIPARSSMGSVIQCPGMTITHAGLRIDRCDSGSLRPEDILLDVGGQPISDFGDLCWALGGLEAGDKVKGVVLRDKKRVAVEIRLAARGQQLDHEEVTRTRLTNRRKASRSETNIRKAIFGN